MLSDHGFEIAEAQIGELGPGDSVGIGLAALLSGASRYVGLDIVPFSMRSDIEVVYEELVELYSRRASIPDHNEFPGVRPRLASYKHPEHIVQWSGFEQRVDRIRTEIKSGLNAGGVVTYKVPWTSPADIDSGSLDLVFSQAVLEHVDSLKETYEAMFCWLKPGGYGSHVVDFSAHHLSPHWNGHWAYSESEWRLVRGQREFLLNRCPLSVHVRCAEQVGFDIIRLEKTYNENGLPPVVLAQQFQTMNNEDLRIQGAVMILRKP